MNSFPKARIGDLLAQYNGNNQIYQCFEFRDTILRFLSRVDGPWYFRDNDGLVHPTPF